MGTQPPFFLHPKSLSFLSQSVTIFIINALARISDTKRGIYQKAYHTYHFFAIGTNQMNRLFTQEDYYFILDNMTILLSFWFTTIFCGLNLFPFYFFKPKSDKTLFYLKFSKSCHIQIGIDFLSSYLLFNIFDPLSSFSSLFILPISLSLYLYLYFIIILYSILFSSSLFLNIPLAVS